MRRLVLAILLSGCSSTPLTVDVIAASPQAITTGQDDADDVTVRVVYHDARADLGGGHASVIDCRAPGLTTRFELPVLADDSVRSRGDAITGELDLTVTDVAEVTAGPPPPECVTAPAPGTIRFCVVLTDAHDRASAPGCSETIEIR